MVFEMFKNTNDNFTPADLIKEYQKDVSFYYDLIHGKYGKIKLQDRIEKRVFEYDHWAICPSTLPGKIAVFVYMKEVTK